MEKPIQPEQRPDDVVGQNSEQAESVEGVLSFEWGPELGKRSWYGAQEGIAKLNKTLKEGETPWRLPTREEWLEVLKPLMEATAKGGRSEELGKIREEIIQKHNLRSENYWSSTTRANFDGYPWVVSIGFDNFNGGGYIGPLCDTRVRCVR